MLGVSAIAILAFFFAKNYSAEAAIPVLGAVALGAQRILPAINKAYTSWSSFHATKKSTTRTIELLDSEANSFEFKCDPLNGDLYGDIEISNVSFKYDQKAEYVFKGLTLNLPKSSIIGIKGSTGRGKSTFVDLVMGLLEPSEGSIRVNGRTLNLENIDQWQSQIAHVPQNIFLIDDSITNNIALGCAEEEIDKELITKVSKQAQIYQFIQTLPEKFEAKVGERGVRLSGGQRQRIGIARALYKKKKLLVLDEATSALDNLTESAIISAIHDMKSETTIMMVAHRLSTLENCDYIIDFDNIMK